jgi:hypothetical protein
VHPYAFEQHVERAGQQQPAHGALQGEAAHFGTIGA